MLFYDGIEADEEKVWLINSKYNVLMEIDRKTGTVLPCGIIPDSEKLNYMMLYRYMFKYEKKLFLFPYVAENICIYDLDEKKFELVKLDSTKHKENCYWEFTGCNRVKNKVIVYGFNSVILIIDLLTYQIDYLDLEKKLPEGYDIRQWFLRYSYSVDRNLFLIPLSFPCVIEIDVFSEQVKFYKLLENDNIWIDNPVLDHSFLYYFERIEGNSVILTKHDLHTQMVERYDFGIKKLKNKKVFGFVAVCKDILWMLPGTYGDGYKFDLKRNKLEKLNHLPVNHVDKLGDDYPYEFNYRNGFVTEDNHIIAVHSWTSQLVDINMINGKIKVVPLKKGESGEWNKLFDELLDNSSDNNIKKERVEGILHTYLMRIFQSKKLDNGKLENGIGDMIYLSLKNG